MRVCGPAFPETRMVTAFEGYEICGASVYAGLRAKPVKSRVCEAAKIKGFGANPHG